MMALKVLSPSTRQTGPSTELLSIGASVPIGSKGKVYVWGWNDTTIKQRMGIKWVVRDPDGVVVEDYKDGAIDWSFEYVNPDEDHRFYGDQFDLDKVGTYTIAIELFMNPDSPVVVDDYEGALCTTTLELPPEYELVYHHEYPLGKTYIGKAEECTSIVRIPLPDQFFPNNWVIEKIADNFADKVAEEGGEMLDIKIYEDTTPIWHTDYTIVATAKASPLAWGIIIPLVLVILLVVAFTILVVEFKEIDWGEIPTPIPWAILALAGGVAVVGVGAAIALTARRE